MVKTRYIHILYVRHMSGILNRTRVKKHIDELPVSRETKMADLSRHFKWKYS